MKRFRQKIFSDIPIEIARKKVKMDKYVLTNPEQSKEYDNEPSLGHVVVKNLTAAGEKIVLISGVTSEELSAKDLLKQSIEVARALKAAGIKPGDVVSIVSENRLEFAYCLFGSILYNVTVAPINLTYSEREMTHAFNLSKPKLIFMSAFASEKVVNVAKSLSFVQKIILIDDENVFGSWVMLFKDFIGPKMTKETTFELKPVDKSKSVSIILCSSGTTGDKH